MARSWGWAFFFKFRFTFLRKKPERRYLIGYSLSLCFELSGDA